MRRSPSKLKRALPQSKIDVTSKSPVGDISVVTLIRTDTTLDHSQEAEKVYRGIDLPDVDQKKISLTTWSFYKDSWLNVVD